LPAYAGWSTLNSDPVLTILALGAVLAGAAASGLAARAVADELGSGLRLGAVRARELGVDPASVTPSTLRARRATQLLNARLRHLLPRVFAWRDARASERHAVRCARDLPDMIDILTLGLQSGLSFDAALSAYVEHFDTPLAAELEHAQRSYQLGICSRRQALQQLCVRVSDDSVMRFVAVVNDALTLGSPLLATFGTLSFELRRYQKLKLEERIARAPVKLLVPLGLCVLPAVLILLMGPVLIQMISGLHL